ncbi:MAG TPA: hypothetical protein EYQ61_03700 [Dehalococcoidia bacterium]|jgi:hypothetical protein|nr:hypothetical protein [Dehalococcoidia bacterium]HIK88348.1 hypothetical protein [Dehalococcoidia bacterium]
MKRIEILVIALMALLVISCGASDSTSMNIFEENVPNFSERNDLSDIDNVDETELEIIRLLTEGHVMYRRFEIFNKRMNNPLDCTERPGSRPKEVCESYPERVVGETWESAESSGMRTAVFGRESNLDGTVLANSISGERTHIETGRQWSSGHKIGTNLFITIENISVSLERVYERHENLEDGEFLGRPSIVVPEGIFEYQLANPLIQRTTRWQDSDDGSPFMLSEAKVTDFAMLPPNSFPN